MAQSAKRRQQKLAVKARKKKQKTTKISAGPELSKNKAVRYGKFPFHECLISQGSSDLGMKTVIVSKRAPQDVIAVSAFVIDTFCLGVKDALFKVHEKYDYDSTFKPSLMGSHEDQTFEDIDPCCARKFIEGAIAYAEELGFPPNPDCKNAINIFGDIERSDCSVEYTYGKDGKPFYINGPHESSSTVRRIIHQLEQKCGKNGFHYLAHVDEDFEQ